MAKTAKKGGRPVSGAAIPRITTPLRKALIALSEGKLTTAEAAELAGMNYESLRIALKKPHVEQYRRELRAAKINGLAERAVQVVEDLMINSTSDAVRLEAAKTVMEMTGVTEQGRRARDGDGQGNAAHPGYVMLLPPTAFGDQQVLPPIAPKALIEHSMIDVTPDK